MAPICMIVALMREVILKLGLWETGKETMGMKWRFKMDEEKSVSGWAVPQGNALTMADVTRIMWVDQERLDRMIRKLRERQARGRERLS